MEQVSQRISEVRTENNLSSNATVPSELVSLREAALTAYKHGRSDASGATSSPGAFRVRGEVLVYQHIEPAQFGIMGQRG